MSEIDEIVREFLVESGERLDRLDQDLITLEKDPENKDLLAGVFRCIHTIKGTCGFFAFNKLEAVTHAGENVLSHLRDGLLRLSPALTSVLLAMVDSVREMLACIESHGHDGDADYTDLIAELQDLSGVQLDSGPTEGGQVEFFVPIPDSQQQESSPEAPQEREIDAPSVSDNTIRVRVDLLDRLMNLVGELVLARNQILQNIANDDLASYAQQLNLITSELQENVMQTRMQPIKNVTGKLPRVVRDLANSCGKQAWIEVKGDETELDKKLIEAIRDPLTHIVRNAIDHGIEAPDDRLMAGKQAEGKITLRACHDGGQVTIEITDDGRGIDPDQIRFKAIERAVINAETAAKMSDEKVVHLIFNAGLSTAKRVTNISGRGVGMDVVKSNIESIGGSVDLSSSLGEGTTLKLNIPLTLAIVPALVVVSGGEHFAIPQASLLEMVRLDGERGLANIEVIRGARFYRLRGKVLPLVDLNQQLALEGRDHSQTPQAMDIVVVQSDGHRFGLIVDEVSDAAEIVVKPLCSVLRSIGAFAGATILGDGCVALILDVRGIAEMANVISQVREQSLISIPEDAGESRPDQQSLIIFQSPVGRRMALPLDRVERLEKIPIRSIERAGERDVIQYRGDIVPLDWVDQLPSSRRASASVDEIPDAFIHVVVFERQGSLKALAIGRVLDIVNDHVNLTKHPRSTGLLGSAVIADRVTDVLDIETIAPAEGLQAEKVA